MRHPKLNEDIQPLSEFRANAAAMLARVRSTKRPLVLTQRGHSAAVVVDVAEYEHLVEEIELLRDVTRAERQVAEQAGVTHRDAKRQLLDRFND